MKVTGNNPSVNLDTYLRNAKKDEKVKESSEQGGKVSRGEDAVTLSPKAKEIQEARKLLDSVPDVREEKIAEIRKAIENGNYKIGIICPCL